MLILEQLPKSGIFPQAEPKAVLNELNRIMSNKLMGMQCPAQGLHGHTRFQLRLAHTRGAGGGGGGRWRWGSGAGARGEQEAHILTTAKLAAAGQLGHPGVGASACLQSQGGKLDTFGADDHIPNIAFLGHGLTVFIL